MIAIRDIITDVNTNSSPAIGMPRLEGKLDVVAYSGNAELFGARNLLIADRSGFRILLKRCRQKSMHLRLLHRTQELNRLLSEDRFAPIREIAVAGKKCTMDGQSYILFTFIEATNGYHCLRNGTRSKTQLPLLESTLNLCSTLDEAGVLSAETNSTATAIRTRYHSACSGKCMTNVPTAIAPMDRDCRAVRQTLVHNDLGPANLLIAGDALWVLDWEYWDVSYSIFNFFDVLTHFFSLISISRLCRRRDLDYFAFFLKWNAKRSRKASSIVAQYATQMGYDRIDAGFADMLFELYLMNKSTSQLRVYGHQSNLDRHWQRLAGRYRDYRGEFRAFWNSRIRSP